jgi:hypothetical protein
VKYGEQPYQPGGNKKVRHFFESMIIDKYRSLQARKWLMMAIIASLFTTIIIRQIFQKTVSELKTLFSALEKFIQYRVKHGKVNMSLLPNFRNFSTMIHSKMRMSI